MDWIAVSERSPEFGKEVLIWDGRFYAVGYLHRSGRWVDVHGEPTHWMQLPPEPSANPIGPSNSPSFMAMPEIPKFFRDALERERSNTVANLPKAPE